MKEIIYIVYFISCNYLFAQQDNQLHYSLSGVVTEEDSKKVLEGATVKLVGSDNTSVEIKTDKNGKYIFPNNALKSNTSYVVSASGIDIKTEDFPNGVLGNPKAKVTTVGLKESTNFTQDFILKRINTTHYYPLIVFKQNSSEFYDTTMKDSIKTLWKWFEYSGVVLEIKGCAGNTEKNPKQLALKRAEVVKNEFVKLGNSPKRFITKGIVIADSSFINSEEYKLRKKYAPIEQYRTRIIFLITRRDFPIDKKAPEIKVTDEGW